MQKQTDKVTSIQLLMKLGSIVVHADELTSPGGHEIDAEAIRGLVQDEEVQLFIKSMGPLLPVKRDG